MELLCCNSPLFVSLLIPILMCCVTEQQINKEELGTTTERGKMGCTEEARHIQHVSGKPGVQEEVWGRSVLPIHQNYKIFYFCLSLLLKKKKKVISVTAQEINDILGSVPAPCSLQPPRRLPGIGAPLLPLPGIESWSHSPSASFVTFQS